MNEPLRMSYQTIGSRPIPQGSFGLVTGGGKSLTAMILRRQDRDFPAPADGASLLLEAITAQPRPPRVLLPRRGPPSSLGAADQRCVRLGGANRRADKTAARLAMLPRRGNAASASWSVSESLQRRGILSKTDLDVSRNDAQPKVNARFQRFANATYLAPIIAFMSRRH